MRLNLKSFQIRPDHDNNNDYHALSIHAVTLAVAKTRRIGIYRIGLINSPNCYSHYLSEGELRRYST